MKTKLFVLLFLVYASTFAQYTTIPDTKFEEKLITLGIDDVADGKVLTSKINALTKLDLNNGSITDLTGIQDFVALTELYCSYNKLTSLDLSKNTALTTLQFNDNLLNSIDLSKNTALKALHCSFNKLTNLDVSNNTALTTLDCSQNLIVSLDLKKNTSLSRLYCNGNKLTYLNIKNGKNTSISTYSLRLGSNLALTCITVDNAVYSNTNWSTSKDLAAIYSSYDCSSITQIPDAKFEDKLIALGIDTDAKNGLILNSSIASLTTLDVSNSSITDLSGLEGFTALKTLNCSNNLLPRIDISKNTALTSLDCSNNTTLTCIQVVDINVAKTNITTTQEAKDKFNLDCIPYTLIPDTKFEAKLISLGYDNVADGKVETKKINKIQTLYISNSSIADLTGIQDFAALKDLDCGYNQLVSLDVSKNTSLTSLVCRNNKLTSIDISKNVALETLNVSNNQLTSLKTINNTLLYHLICNSNKITQLDFSKNTALTSIYCNTNQLTSLNIKNGNNTKINALSYYDNPTLTCVVVDDVEYAKNKWGIESSTPNKTFSLYECSTVTPISDAKFEDKLIALGIDTDGKNGIVFNTSITGITSLDVSNSSISDLSGIEGFTALKTLNCSNNVLSNINISKNTALTSLDCSNNTNLTCIQVVDINTAKTTISTSQEAKDKFGLDCTLYTLIPDINFENKLIALGYDTTADGKVETKKISGIKTLDVSHSSISDLTGIQDFTSLTSLNCQNNYYLASLDLSKNINLTNLVCYSIKITNLNISKNTKLTNLDCNSNQLTSLDLSNNTALETVNCYNNLLTNLNVSNNTALKTLTCMYNSITNLDVSKVTALSVLECNNNKITGIDVSQNKNLKTLICNANKLTYLNLKNQNTSFKSLNCTGNLNLSCITVNDVATANSQWTNAKDSSAYFTNQDCATITIIPDAFFEDKLIALNIDTDGKNGSVLNSSIEKVTSLDVSNSSITDLTGLEGFKALTTLNCSNNLLKNLNLSKNTNITTLSCTNNTALTCIQVLDVAKTTKNWTVTKDAATSFSLDCAVYTLIPDSNFETRLITLGFDDIADGKIKTANIDKITSLNLYRASIKNLKGIEDFKALSILNCSQNDLINLDLSKNSALTSLDCSWNDLVTLNLKNGKNTLITYLYLSVNSDLNCITVDNVAYANANWSSKKNSTATFTTYDCEAYTIIKDSKFEDKLISLGIDTDGKNGLVTNSSIEKITQLDISNSSITNLTGIEGFKALTQLNCSNNALTTLNLDKNTTLTKIECQSNQITDLDIDKCLSLTYLNASSNKLTSGFSSYNLKALTWLDISNNSITYVNMYNNSELLSLFCNNNKITSLSTYYFPKIKEINCSNNQITDLSTSGLTALVSLNAAGNKLDYISLSSSKTLESLDVSGNTITSLSLAENTVLSKLNCSNNKIGELNISQNTALTKLNCSTNSLTLLNINNNTALTELDCSANQLTALYLKNGNNTKLNTSTINFSNNPALSCILVDNKSYSDSNWSNTKDAGASFETNCTIYLLPNNFTILTKSEFCYGQNNGEISITAVEKFAYTASINGVSKKFTDNSLTITDLAPGKYDITITIPGENFEQKYTVTIEKAAKITGKSTVSSKKVDVEITHGTAPYTVFVNGKEQFETNTSNFSVSANGGDLLEVKTAKACEGIYSENLSGVDIMVSTYPNPTSGSFTIGLPILKNEVTIEIRSIEGHLISTKNYSLENGVAQLTLENEPKGVYLAKIYLDTVKTVKIIKK